MSIKIVPPYINIDIEGWSDDCVDIIYREIIKNKKIEIIIVGIHRPEWPSREMFTEIKRRIDSYKDSREKKIKSILVYGDNTWLLTRLVTFKRFHPIADVYLMDTKEKKDSLLQIMKQDICRKEMMDAYIKLNDIFYAPGYLHYDEYHP